MTKFKSLEEILSNSSHQKELYSSDEKKRYFRSKKGHFTRNKGTFDFIHLIKNWENLVGALMAENTIPLKIRFGTLYISSKHSVFAQELSFLAPEIIKKIEIQFPNLRGKIKKIKFSFSHFSVREFKDSKSVTTFIKKEKVKKQLHPYSPQYLELKSKADSLFSDIEDEEVKKSLTQFFLEN